MFDIKNSIFLYQEIIFDINKYFLLSKNRFLDIKKSISWYQKMNFWYKEYGMNSKRVPHKHGVV